MLRLFLVLTFVLVGCAPTLRIPPGQIPAVERPPKELKTEAEGYVKAYIDEAQFKELQSGAGLQRTKNVVEKLSKAAGYPPHTFPIHLVDAGEEVNAAAVNGASILVYNELLKRVKSDPELATVLAHEIGHIVAKHYADQAEEQSRANAVSIGSSILGAAANIATSAAGYSGSLAGDLTESAAGVIGYGVFVGSFSRTQEYEADHLGLLIMAKAQYDPHVAIEFWKRADEIFGSSSSQVGSFFSTHPASSDRIKALEEALPYALTFYKQK